MSETRMIGHVVVRCVTCHTERRIAPGEIPKGDIPMCETCLSPMVAARAVAEEVRIDV